MYAVFIPLAACEHAPITGAERAALAHRARSGTAPVRLIRGQQAVLIQGWKTVISVL
jgi:hypothetical protein